MRRELSVDYMVRATWGAISRMYNEQARKHDSTMVYGFTLLCIDPKQGSVSMSLGPKMGIEPTSLSRTLNNLEKEGLIERYTSPRDKRNVIIRLTKKGLEMRDVSKAYVLEFQRRIQKELSAEELSTLIETLTKIQKVSTEILDEQKNPREQ